MTKIVQQAVSIPATTLTLPMALEAVGVEFATASKQALNLTSAVALVYVIDHTLVSDDKARRKVEAITKDVKAVITATLWERHISRFRKSFKVDGKTDEEVHEIMVKRKLTPGASTIELYLTMGSKLFATLERKGHLKPGTGLVKDIASCKLMSEAISVLVNFMGLQEAKSAEYYSAGVHTVDDLRVYNGGNPRAATAAPKPVAERVADILRVDPSKEAPKASERAAIIKAIPKALPWAEQPSLIIQAAEGIAALAAGGNQKAMDALEDVTKRMEVIRDKAHEANIKALEAQRSKGKSVVVPTKRQPKIKTEVIEPKAS